MLRVGGKTIDRDAARKAGLDMGRSQEFKFRSIVVAKYVGNFDFETLMNIVLHLQVMFQYFEILSL
ncbi:MAG: hypothetical protein ACI84R_001378 [Candidatus Azotimanducaceae bacterium]|jgi:hypothetical protein